VTDDRIRVLRVITRMNLGGPAHHVSLLSGRLDPCRYDTLLVAGRVGPGEESAENLAEKHGARLELLTSLGPRTDPRRDIAAVRRLQTIIRAYRPHVVHTHTAKAGFVGRLAASVARPRPLIVHTYHGHVLEGYFGRLQSAFFLRLERAAAAVSDRLLGVSQSTVDDLVRLGVAPEEKFSVVPIGLDLDTEAAGDRAAGSAFRAEIGASDDETVVTYVGRLVPIKHVHDAVAAVAHARRAGALIRLAVVGDGDLRVSLERQAAELKVAQYVSFTGYRAGLRPVIAGTDVALLSSANEGTPAWLIEAAAGSVPAVATAVGGVPDVVTPATGVLVPSGDVARMGDALAELAGDPPRRRQLGEQAVEHVRWRFSAQRLLEDVDALYSKLLRERREAVAGRPTRVEPQSHGRVERTVSDG